MKRVSIKNKIFLFLLVVCFSTVIICSTLISKNKNEVPSILTEMEENAGEYNTNKIVLNNTTKSEAKSIATRLNAKLRINKAETFATITLPDDLTVYEICKDPNNKDIVDKFSLDYHAKVSEIEDTVNEYLSSRPLYNANDEYYDKQTYLDYINLSNTWGSLTGYGVTVAIIDTGIDTDHPEFAGRISEYSYNATEDKIVKDYLLEDGSYDWSLIEDVQGHGTSVAGVIGASLNNGIGIAGIAPNVELLVIKAECNEKGTFYSTSDLVFGLYYAIERDVDVVNMSFGIQQSNNPFAEPAQLAKDSDIICVAAAGNDGEPTVNYPAGDPNVIGVGALASNSWELANYSNYGDGLDVVAPGTVYTTAIGGGYQVMNGTSFSSPIVAASIALYFTRDHYQELKDIYELLAISSKDLGDIGKDFYYGYGALDINAMINEEKGVVTFNYLTNEIENTTQRFVRNHTLQQLPEPERLYAVFDGWYYDIHCTEPLNDYIDKFSTDLTLYAKWINEDDGVPFTYKVLNDDTVEITGYRGKRKFITVPSIIDGKTVSSIGKNAFKGETKLRRVTLPETIKSIGEGAFYNCINLTSMVVPDSVIKIGENAFRECIRLVNISFNTNSKLEYIGDYAFSSCLKITTLKLPKNVSYFNGSAVYGTTKLTKIEVDKDNKYFKSINGVLYNSTINTLVAYPANKGLSYEINNKTKIIGQFAFACGKVEEVNLKNVEQIGDYAFLKSNIKSADLSNVFNVGISIYTECMFLENVNLGDKIDKISAGMFSECISLKEINIPKQVQEIGISGFARSGLEKVIFLKFSELKIISKSSFIMTSLIEIEIPSSVVYIGEGTFSGSQLKNITFAADSQLSYIGELAFEYTAIERVQLPNKLIAIGNYAFKNTNLKNVSIPSSVVQLGNGVFASCYSLTSIDVEDNNENYVSLDGVVYSKDLTHLVMYPGGKNSYPYVVNENTKVINDSAFYGAYALLDIQFNNGLEEIDQYAFYDVQNVCTYKLPSTLVSIGNYAFSNNKNLEYVNIPDSVLKIGRYAFMNDYNCYRISFNETSKLPRISYGTFAYSGITSFIVPSNVSTIAQGAFIGCNRLTDITFNKNSKLTSISAYMFDGCSNLQTITFQEGSKLSSIQAHGLEGMSKLTTIDFGDAVITNIDNFAFRFCSSLTTLNLSEGLTYIGRFAFYGCESLQSLTIPTTIEFIGRYAFYNDKNLELYFISELLPLYTQDYWDHSIKGYYLGVKEVKENDEYKYAILNNDEISIIEYKGSNDVVDLSKANLGGNIITIGSHAFEYKNVTRIILPNTIITIGSYAFNNTPLQEINFVDSIKYIGSFAFYNTNISSAKFSDESKLEKIDNNAFASCDNLLTVTLPKTLNSLGNYSFYESGIINLTLSKEMPLEIVPKCAFEFTHIRNVILPNNVTEVSDNAFANIKELRTVTFNDKNLKLMSNAFYNTGLIELSIPANIEYIGEYSLIALENLTEYKVDENNKYYKVIDGAIYSKDGKKLIAYPAGKEGNFALPKEVESIGFGAFESSKINNVDFSQNTLLTTIGYRAFFKCNNLESVVIPANVISIDYYAFAYCKKLKQVVFEENSKLNGIYEGSFCGCTSLNSIVIPDNVVELSEFSFYGCTSLDKLPITKNSKLQGIYDYAFSYSGITSLVIPQELIEIGNYAFSGSKLKTVNLINNKKDELHLGIGIFEDCLNLEEISIPFIGRYYNDEKITWFGYIFGAGGYKANSTYVPTSLKTITLDDGQSYIGIGAFYKLKDVERINLPHSIDKVYEYSFYECNAKYRLTNNIKFIDSNSNEIVEILNQYYIGKGIVELHIENGIIRIENYTFAGCNNLINIELPISVISIGNSAFSGCSSLTNIEIPNNVISIGSYAFSNCYNLNKIIIPNGITKIENETFYNCGNLVDIEIPNTIKEIGESSFRGCSSLTNIIISEGITSIGDYAFAECSSLVNVIIPKGVTNMGNSVFVRCANLIDIIILEGVTNIGDYAFAECSNLKHAKIPNSVISVGESAFAFCENLTNIEFSDNITSIGNSAFEGCNNIKNISIPSNLKKLGSYAFRYCYDLVNIEIPDSLEDMGNGVFSYCNSLIGIKLPNCVTKIDKEMFYFCNKLTSLEITSSLLVIEEGALDWCNLKEIYYKDTVEKFIKNMNLYSCLLNTSHFFILKDNAYSEVSEITLPETMTSVSAGLFRGCGFLRKIIVPKSVTSIDEAAFDNCTNLVSVVLPDTLKIINNWAFSHCTNLTNINIPDSVVSIGEYAFYNCSSLSSITVPKNIISIGDSAFLDCFSLIEIINNSELDLTIGSTDNGYIAYNAIKISDKDNNITYKFNDNIYIETQDGFLFTYNGNIYQLIAYLGDNEIVELPKNINDANYYIYEMRGVKKVIIPETIVSIGQLAFSGCTTLESVVISNATTLISNSAFSDCNNLTSITLSDSITNIEDLAFAGCTNLVNVYYNGTVENWFKIKFSSITSNPMYYATNFYILNSNNKYSELTEIVIPKTITEIYDYQLVNFNNIERIFVHSNVRNISSQSFVNCENINIIVDESNSYIKYFDNVLYSNLQIVYVNDRYSITEIELLEGITSIENETFLNCISLESIIFPTTLVKIGDSAFKGCAALKDVNIPFSVTNIGNNAFDGCSSLVNVKLSDCITSIENETFINCTNLISIKIPDSVTKIGERVFYGCSNLTNIEIPNSIANIGGATFAYCDNLTSIVLPNELKIIEGWMFYNCINLTNIVISENITIIEANAFYNCNSLTNIVIPKEVTSIGNSAFSGCSSLTSIELPSALTSIESRMFEQCSNLMNIVIPKEVTSIGNSAFSGCSSLTSIVIPDGVTSIGGSAFSGCSSLINISIPNNVTIIEDYSFSWCSSLTSIKIPNSVTSIGSSAFRGCSSLTTIELPNSICDIGANAFAYCSGLISIKLSSSVKSIGESAFIECNSLENVYYDGTITNWCELKFFNISSNPMAKDEYRYESRKHFYMLSNNQTYEELTKLVIPNIISEIGDYQFCGFENLISIELPNSIMRIGESAFYGSDKYIQISAYEYKKVETEKMIYYNGTVEDWCNVELSNETSNPMYYGEKFYMLDETNVFREIIELIIPNTVTRIKKYSFINFKSIKSVVVPSTIIEIEDNAFYECDNILTINNSSDIQLSIGSSDNGYIAYNAISIVDKNNNRTYINGDEYIYYETNDRLLFRINGEIYQLIAYLGDAETIVLPNYINNNTYNIYSMKGAKKIVIPNTFTNIDDYAFYNCTTLINIIIPNSVQNIGNYAFYGCSSLTDIELETENIGYASFENCYSLKKLNLKDGVISIESGAFRNCYKLNVIYISNTVNKIGQYVFENTAFYNDELNWYNDILYINNHLIKVRKQLKFFAVPDNILSVAEDAFFDSYYSLKSIKVKDYERITFGMTNIETIFVEKWQNKYIYANILNYYSTSSLVLKNIVLGPNVELSSYNMNIFTDVTGINIFISKNKNDCPWDENFPNWNNGNNVYYVDEWITVDFYDENNQLYLSNITFTNEVIKVPHLELTSDERYNYELIGWDLDGDGIADSIPATSTRDIVAKPIIKKVEKMYTIRFMDDDKVLYQYVLPYGAILIKPEDPFKKGYRFNGWLNFNDSLIVTNDIDIIANFVHDADGHDYSFVEKVEPTCENDGYTKHICTICDEYIIIDIVKALGHDYSLIEKVEPTCEKEGYTKHTCSNCSHTRIDNILDKLPHTYGEWVIVQNETCTADGLKSHKCEKCGYEESVIIDAHEHTFAEEIIQEATCENEGIVRYICSECKMQIDYPIDKLEHTYEKKYVSISFLRWIIEKILNIIFGYEGSKGYYYECTMCHRIKTIEEETNNGTSSTIQNSTCKHVMGDWYVGKESTCIDYGLEFKDCIICNKHIEFRAINGLSEHSLIHHDKLDPTCTTKGHTEYDTCSRCDYTTYKELPSLGHTSSDWIIDKDPTCIVDGSKHKECTVCYETLVTEVINKLGHDLIHHEKLDPTCTTKGHSEYDTCSRCDYTTYKELPATGHKSSEWIIDKDSTCIVDGTKHKECTACHETLVTEVINKLGHNLIHHEKLDPTCTTTGHTEYDTCSRCDYTTYKELPATGHKSSDWIIDKDSTCIVDGSKHKECTVCHETLITEVINKLGHDLIHHEKLDPTCTKAGHTEYDTCSRCDYTTYKELPSLGHKESNWIIDKDSTCIIDGSKHKECTVCHETLVTEVINKLGHDLEHHEKLDPTCTKVGHTEYDTCSRCDYTTYKELPSLGHKESDWIIDKDPTCIVDGSKHKECTVCHETLVTEVINKLGHDLIHHEKLDSTCTTKGHTEYDTCSRCDYTTFKELPSLGHTSSDWIIDKDSKCLIDGSKHKECTVCHETLVTEVINKLGHDLIHHDKLDPTCTKTGHTEYDTCSRCDYTTFKELPSLGHKESEWIIDKDSTCIIDGSKHKECTVCHETLKTEVINKLGHDLIHHKKLDPTCTTKGHTEYDTCSRCDYTTFKELPSLGHKESDWIIDKASSCKDQGHQHKECTVCHETLVTEIINKLGHDLIHHEKLDPTCTTKGHTEYDTCSRCDYTTFKELPSLGHKSSDWIIDKDSTCLVDGSKHKECTVCHETLVTEVINKLGHDLIHHDKLDPTCITKGHSEYDTCSRCDYTTFKELPSLGHKESNWIIDKDPTCLIDGSKHKECTVCHETLVTEVINKLGHDLIHHDKLEPTCTTKGHTEYDTCSRCDYSNYEDLPALGHTESDWIIDKDPTCLVDGTKHKECTVCHDVLVTEVINKLGHDLIHHDKLDPTCTKTGHTEYDTCSRCDYTTFKELPSLGHKESNWIIDKDSTCIVDGSKHKECTVCHETLITEVINKLGHDLIHHEKLDPTCTTKGHTEYDTCSRCDYSNYEDLPALGHTESDWIIDKASSCNDQGHQHKECTICGEVLVDEPIVKSGNCNSNTGFIQVLHLIAISGFMILIRKKKNS